MTNPDLTEIICVIDRSGSMGTIRNDAISGFNTFLEDQKAVDKPCKMTYAQFDTTYEVIHSGVDLQAVPPLTTETYVPRGGTALFDAVGRTIDEVGIRLAALPESERPGKVVFVILTDGEENSSCEFTRERILGMIRHQQEKYKWDFVFLAANQDAFAVGTSIGISYNANFIASGAGVKRAYAGASTGIAEYRVSCDSIGARESLATISDLVEETPQVQNSTSDN